MDHTSVIIYSSIFNFGVVAVILFMAAKKALPGVLEKRSDEVSLMMREAEAQFKEAEAALMKWESNLKTSKTQAEELQKDAEIAVRRLRESTIEAAKNQVSRMESDSKLFAASEKKKSQSGLLREIVDRSTRLVEENLGEQLSEQEGKRLVSRVLESV